MLRLAVCVLLALAHMPVSAEAPRGHWPQWRGPNRDNVSADVGLLSEWPAEGPPLRWSVRGIGNGIAAVAVADGRIITLGDIDGHECVMALDEQSGRRLWATAIGPAVADSGVMRLMDIFCPIGSGLSITRFGVRRESGSWQVTKRYKRKAMVDPFQDGSVVVGDHVYLGLQSTGVLGCFNLRTGEEVWRHRPPRERGDSPDGRAVRQPSTADGPSARGFGGSGPFAFRSRRLGLTYADCHLYCLRADGTVQLIRPDPTGYVEAFSLPFR